MDKAEVKGESQVEQELQRLGRLTDGLQEICSQVEDRLTNILREKVKPEAVPTTERPTVVHLANRIREANEVIEHCTDFFSSIIDRLEV